MSWNFGGLSRVSQITPIFTPSTFKRENRQNVTAASDRMSSKAGYGLPVTLHKLLGFLSSYL
jgi:hypothetical protein